MPSAIRLLTSGGASGGRGTLAQYAHPRYAGLVEDWEARPVDDMPASDLLVGVEELLEAGAEYYTSVQTIIPLAAIGEIAFTQFYERLVRREGDPPAQNLPRGFDSMPIKSREVAHDLGTWTQSSPDLAGALEAHRRRGRWNCSEGRAAWGWTGDLEQWRSPRVTSTVTAYRLQPRLREPRSRRRSAPLLDTLGFYVRGEGQNPYERQGGRPPRVVRRRRWRCARVWTPRGKESSTLLRGRKASRRCVKTPSPTLVWPGP